MIKYVELTAPEASAYRQAKIISFECQEGDYIKKGDTLFVVQSGNSKLELPSTKDGKIVEFIVSERENINLATPLLLLETKVPSSTASKPIDGSDEAKKTDQNNIEQDSKVKAQKVKKSTNKTIDKSIEQQSLDLSPALSSQPPKRSLNEAQQNHASATHQATETNSMSDNKVLTILVPDIGADAAKVIEILVSKGDQISSEDAIVTLESDKASMDVPSPYSGLVKSISVSIDQDVSEGHALMEIEVSESQSSSNVSSNQDQPVPEANVANANADPKSSQASQTPSQAHSEVIITIPDIGGDSAKVVEILVSVGEEVNIDDSLITLESDKASMDVPSTVAGVISSVEVSVDDEVSEGHAIITISTAATSSSDQPERKENIATQSANEKAEPVASSPAPVTSTPATPASETSTVVASTSAPSHASPSIRRFARELGVDLSKVKGTGRKNRVVREDVKAFVKGVMSNSSAQTENRTSGSGIPAVPVQDFSKFGEIEVSPLNKIKRLTASNLHRSWLNVPHVTHNDETNISNLEDFRKQLNAEYKAQKKDIKLSPLAFIVKAVVNALQVYPQFNSSLESGGENLILKKYFHIGIAVDTPNGLVVPVIKNVDTKSVAQLAKEMGELAQKARDKKLTMNDMSGACFTISSLGGIGGTSFTPIVNAPEVAILGVARSQIKPVWNGDKFIPSMMLPLSLSYDHRVIDGAEAAKFTRHIASALEDVRRLTV